MGVNYLLDTHVLLWLLSKPDRVPEHVRTELADPMNKLVVSAASALEVSTKVRLGKLEAPGLVDSWAARVQGMGADTLTISAEHALLAGRLSWEHRDPFDRLFVAQAILEGLSLVTVDSAIATLPAPPITTW